MKNKTLESKKEWSKGFTDGLFYALEQLVVFMEDYNTAEWLLQESGIPLEEFELCCKESVFKEAMTKFINDMQIN